MLETLAPFASQTTPDSFFHVFSRSPHVSSQKQHVKVIFFIPGNPGLIAYYRRFLELLAAELCPRSASGSKQYVVYGASLFGFELSHDTAQGQSLRAEARTAPFSLQEQIDLTYHRLQVFVRDLGYEEVDVTLVGHSVGAYIALEVLRLHRSSSAAATTANKTGVKLDTTSLILLTPTIMELALSPNGRIAAPIVKFVPFLPRILQVVAKTLTSVTPRRMLEWLVGFFVNNSTDATETTIAFLKSRHGVRQSISMTIDELAEITTSATVDKWDATTTIGRSSPPKIYLFFAHTDRWIAPSTRHRIVRAAARASDVEGKGTVAVHVDEEEGVVHGFCIRNSDIVIVAKHVLRWILLEEEGKS